MELPTANEEYTFRNIQEDDYEKSYKELLSDLTSTGNLDESKFKERFAYRALRQNIYSEIVVENNTTQTLIGCGTLLIIQDWKNNGKNIGFIEEIVVKKSFQGKGFGKKIIDKLLEIAIEKRCNHVNLDCGDDNEQFYNKCGLRRHGYELSIYF